MRPRRLNEEEWRQMLLGNGTFLSRTNQIFRHLPSDPRCKLCHAPYGGVAWPIMKLLGYGKYPANPQLCNACFRQSAAGIATDALTARRIELRGRAEALETWSEGVSSAVS